MSQRERQRTFGTTLSFTSGFEEINKQSFKLKAPLFYHVRVEELDNLFDVSHYIKLKIHIYLYIYFKNKNANFIKQHILKIAFHEIYFILKKCVV